MIAMAITCKPDLLIADEPTTALDVTVQAQVLEVLIDIKDEIDSAIILITHDLGVVAGLADQVMVMYAGRQVEMGTTDGDLLRVAPPLHARAAGQPAPPRRRRRRAARADHGLAAVADPPPAGLRVPPAVPVRPGARACATPRCPSCASSPATPTGPPATTPRRSRASPSTRCAPRSTRPSWSRPRSIEPAEAAARDRRRPTSAADATPRRRRRRRCCVATDLVKDFPIRGGVLGRTVGYVSAVAGVSLEVERRRDARPGGRVRLRQVHHRPDAARPDPAHLGRGALRRAVAHQDEGQGAGADAAPLPDRLPGPVRVAQPAHDGRAPRWPSR